MAIAVTYWITNIQGFTMQNDGSCPLFSDHGKPRLGDTEYYRSGERDFSRRLYCLCCGTAMTDRYYKQGCKFALLTNCSCVVCVPCVRWHRIFKGIGNTCPVCKTGYAFYVSNNYWLPEGRSKLARLCNFLKYTATQRCAYAKRGVCKYGSWCIYKHENQEDDTEDSTEEKD